MKQNTKIPVAAESVSRRVDRFLADGEYPHITRQEYEELHQTAEGAVQRLLLEVLWTTGARISEVLGLRARDLARRAGEYELDILRLKRREPIRETLPIPSSLGHRIEDYLELQGLSGEDPLFDLSRSTAWRWIRALGEEALDRDVTPHMFRHGRVYDLVRQGTHPFMVAKIVGHVDLQTTLGYFHPEKTDIRQAMCL